jgi:hypothetical protein
LLLVFKLLSKPDWRDGEDVLGCCRAFQAEADDLRFRVMGFRKPDRIPGGWRAAGKARLLWRGESGSPKSSQVVSLGV